jgi:hypothetical protein
MGPIRCWPAPHPFLTRGRTGRAVVEVKINQCPWMFVTSVSGVQSGTKSLLLLLDPQGHPEHAKQGPLGGYVLNG